MKIAFFVGKFPVLSETFVIRTVVGLIKLGHDVTVITGEWGNPELDNRTYKEYGLEKITTVIRKTAVGKRNRIKTVLAFILSGLFSIQNTRQIGVALRALLSGSEAAFLDIAAQSPKGKLGTFDAVIAHFGFCGVRAMYLKDAGLIDGALITIFHGLDLSHKNVLQKNISNYRRLFLRADKLLPVSKLFSCRLQELGAPAQKIDVMPMGVDTDKITALPFDRPVSSPLRVLTVGRLTEKKGIEYAIRGVALVNHAIELTIIGEGPLDKTLKSLAGEICSHPIIFLGKQSPHDVISQLTNTDVFLLPSITANSGDTEGVPVAIQEAMAMGVIVIGSRHGGIPDLIEDGVSGFLVSERRSDEIALVLNQIAEGKVIKENIRSAARATTEKYFSASQLDLKLEAICKDLSK